MAFFGVVLGLSMNITLGLLNPLSGGHGLYLPGDFS